MFEIYHGDWEDRNDVENDFKVDLDSDVEIVLAAYSYEDYSGTAYVFFKKGDKFFEVEGGHCSCNGLEDQWQPSEASLKELANRLHSGFGYGIPDIPDDHPVWMEILKFV